MHPSKDGNFVIKRNTPEELQKLILEELNRHFKVTAVEKYEDATIRFLFQEGMKKYSRGHGRVSAREHHRIQKYMIDWMRSHYGPYVNVLQRKGKYLFNLTRVYKTEYGRLYGIDKIANLFVTSHALERFEEREKVIEEDFEIMSYKRSFKTKWNTMPTTYDIVDHLMDQVTQFGFPYKDDSILVNIGYGLFVVEVYMPFCVATTYLTSDMKYAESDWFENENVDLLDPVVFKAAKPIEIPVFKNV